MGTQPRINIMSVERRAECRPAIGFLKSRTRQASQNIASEAWSVERGQDDDPLLGVLFDAIQALANL
jgi:hypothetical protein